MAEWQPIETAPKGECILVYGRVWNFWGDEGKDDLSNWEPPRIWMAETGLADGVCYVETGAVDLSLSECRATHWMPLPTPPEVKQ